MGTTCGSLALKGAKSSRNAAVVDELIKNGAIIMGKANLSVCTTPWLNILALISWLRSGEHLKRKSREQGGLRSLVRFVISGRKETSSWHADNHRPFPHMFEVASFPMRRFWATAFVTWNSNMIPRLMLSFVDSVRVIRRQRCWCCCWF